MYAVKNSARAMIVAAIPLAAVHAVFFAMLLLRTQSTPSLLALPSPDKVLVLYVVRLAIDTALLFAGHLALRERAVSSRLAYALMGGVMAASSYALVLRNGLLLAPPNSGSEITAGLLPTFAGMMAGFSTANSRGSRQPRHGRDSRSRGYAHPLHSMARFVCAHRWRLLPLLP